MTAVPALPEPLMAKFLPRLSDPTLSWISREFPQLEPWRELAVAYFEVKKKKPNNQELNALSKFLDRFLVQEGLPTDPEQVLRNGTTLPEFFETACPRSKAGANWNNFTHHFLDFVLVKRFSALDPATGKKTPNPIYRNPVPQLRTSGKKFGQLTLKSLPRPSDPTLSWISREFPQLEPWRELAVAYFEVKKKKPNNQELNALSKFLDRFLVQEGLPTDPEQVLRNGTTLPEFFETACPRSKAGANWNNFTHHFLDFVLVKRFSALDPATGKKTPNPIYRNPVPQLRTSGKKFGQLALKSLPRGNDRALSWVSRDFPQLEPWRELAVAYCKTIKRVAAYNLQALSLFFDRFLVQEGLPNDPEQVLRVDTVLPDFFGTACAQSQGGVLSNNFIRDFLDYVIAERFSTLDPATGKTTLNPNYRNPIPRRNAISFEVVPDRIIGSTKQTDQEFMWVKHNYPQLESWRSLASEWIKGPGAKNGAIGTKLHSLSTFIERYIFGQGLPVEPARLLDRSQLVPSFYETCYPNSKWGIRYNNYIHEFLQFVLWKEFSELDDHGRPVPSPLFHNPVEWRNWSGRSAKRTETNKVPLPYAYISRLRRKLIQGDNFRDWVWAQNALGAVIGKAGIPAPDWFSVTQDKIDPDDPDCVWRARKTRNGDILEMWSPVRWVALAFKLLLPLRTFQVRMLDSGEGDTWWYESGNWVLNKGLLAQGRDGHSRHQGFLHRTVAFDGVTTLLYANTNKSADVGKSGSDKGFIFPWVRFGEVHEDVFYWAEKLRNWQIKYNPISRLTSWRDLDARHLSCARSDLQLSSYPDTSFLFRNPEWKPSERHLPISDAHIDCCWFYLLEAFEMDLAKACETLRNGERIRLVPAAEKRKGNKRKGNNMTTNHPLHSLRVSLITALALDGKVPIEIMQKVVGHSRLLMTIYYVVPGEAHIRLSLEDGVKQLEASAGASMEKFLLNTEFKELMENAIAVDSEGVRAAIPSSPGERNPVGWEMMADGCCLMGGNTSPIEDNGKIGGCYNGGSDLRTDSGRRHGPVPGGPRNCICCRWFVTMPHYLYSLVARLNRLFWENHKEKIIIRDIQQEKDSLDTDRYDAIQAGIPFVRVNELHAVDRRLESSLSRLNVILGNIVACTKLIRRCEAALNMQSEGMEVVTIGAATEIRTRVDETDSELLQLSLVCEGLETYPDLPPAPDAVFRRSQILDMVLMSEGQKPLFLTMTEEQQNLNANAVMREMARRANPSDPILGRIQIVTLMDLKMNLMEHLGFGMAECMPGGISYESIDSAKPAKVKINGKKNVLHDKHSS